MKVHVRVGKNRSCRHKNVSILSHKIIGYTQALSIQAHCLHWRVCFSLDLEDILPVHKCNNGDNGRDQLYGWESCDMEPLSLPDTRPHIAVLKLMHTLKVV